MRVVKVEDVGRKREIARAVLEDLTDWFGIKEAREAYIADGAEKAFFCALDGEVPAGFLYLKPTGQHTVELAVMGVLRQYHRGGVGRALVESAKAAAKEMGYEFMQVKTVRMGMYEDYDRTNRFYLAMGFKEFEVFPTLWDAANPCQIYVMAL